jgi:hypothetical protein
MSLLRKPGGTIDPDQLTGDPVLDEFLRDLDAALLGSRKVRALDVAESKDHLLETRDAHVGRGMDPEAASRAAVSDFGEAREHAETQRHLLRSRFWQTAMMTGPLFAVGMFGFALLGIGATTGSVTSTLVISTIQGVLFGIAMGWFLALVHPPKALPSGDADGHRFVCAYTHRMRKATSIWMILFAVLVVMGIGTALEVDALNPLEFSRPGAIVLGLLALSNIRIMRTGTQRLVVDAGGLEVRNLFRRERISWSQLRELRLLGERASWIPRWSYWSRVHVLEYTDASGAARTVKIFPDAENSGRLIRVVRDKTST